MSRSHGQGAVKHYHQVKAHSSVEGVSPHRLIQLLMEGALEKISMSKGFMQRMETDNKVSHIDWAICILEGLQMSLDLENGGEIAKNLDDLYDYMQRRLIRANVENNEDYLDEVAGLLMEIKSGWDQIPESQREAAKGEGDQKEEISEK